MVRSGLLGLGLAALWACAPREPTVYHVERGRTYVEDRAVVWERIEGFLRANDIAVLTSTSPLPLPSCSPTYAVIPASPTALTRSN